VLVPSSVDGLGFNSKQPKKALRHFGFRARQCSVLGGEERGSVDIGSIDTVLVQNRYLIPAVA